VDEFYRTDLALAAQQGMEVAHLRGMSFVPMVLSFCLGDSGNAEICDMSRESDTSFVASASGNGAVIFVVTIVGLLFAVLCLALLVRWRKEKVIKSASLHFSILMCVGALVGLVSNFFLLERPTNGVCHMRAWLTGVGFVMFIGNFLVKVWRIHVIFNMKVLVKVKIRDSKLDMYFFVLLGIQIVLLGLYSGLGNPTVQRVAHVDQYSLYDDVCVVREPNIWNLLFSIYAALLLIYGVYLAFQVRNLVSLFNEAKLLGGSIYNMIFVAVVCGPILLFLDMPPTSSALIRSLASFAMFTGSLAIVFVPKFCMVSTKPAKDSPPSKHEEDDSAQIGLTADTESLKLQESAQLISQKDKALAMIKAIDGELECRSRNVLG